MMTYLTRKTQGTILVLTLLLVTVMAMLAVSYLLLSTQDYRVAKGEEWSARTFYLARSGLEYYALNQAAMPPGTKQKIAVEEGSLYFDIEVTDTEVIATGIEADSSGRALAQKSLRARLGDVGRWYEAASP
jgi:Tfp pilus assembly protein PilX